MKITMINPMGRMALEMIASIEGTNAPSFEGEVVATEGQDITHIEEVQLDEVREGSLVYFDTGAQRHYHVPQNDVEEVQ